MNMPLEGTPSDEVPEVLATGTATISHAFLSLSARDPDGRDAAYIEWHWMDHRPEQYRLANLRCSHRLVSTPATRAARAASEGRFDAVDHVMIYMFADDDLIGFNALGAALDRAGRMRHRLPSVGYLTGNLAGRIASAHAVIGCDVIPWRPSRGVYLIIEEGQESPAGLVDLPGVAGVWWYHGAYAPDFASDAQGMQITCCYLDEDPIACAGPLGEALRARWACGAARALLAGPFHTVEPFQWDRYLP